jgi:hypothetical protein
MRTDGGPQNAVPGSWVPRANYMNVQSQGGRYNQPIPHMDACRSGSLRMMWRAWLILFALIVALVCSPTAARASALTDSARELAHEIATAAGPGAIELEVTNRSSLDEKSADDVRGAIEAQLRTEGVGTDGVRAALPNEAKGSVRITLSESVREYVWTAEITIGSDEPKVVVVSAPRAQPGPAAAPAMQVAIRKNFLIAQERPILDAALLDMPGGQRLLVLNPDQVGVFRQQSGRWELETSLAIGHTRIFPRDVRGRLLLRRDHLFDVYLPGIACRSSVAGPLTLACGDSDAPWPLTSDDSGIRAAYASARNFFTGAFAPAIVRVSNGPSFYSAAALPRSNYTLWVLAAVDGSVHLLDGTTDQLVRGAKWGSDVAAMHSICGTGTQLLVSENGEPAQDSLRAFEIANRDPVAGSVPAEFDGAIVALWTEASGNGAIAVVKREDTGWYEAYRISIACGN